MTNADSIKCPECGGTQYTSLGEGKVKCQYCDTVFMDPSFVPNNKVKASGTKNGQDLRRKKLQNRLENLYKQRENLEADVHIYSTKTLVKYGAVVGCVMMAVFIVKSIIKDNMSDIWFSPLLILLSIALSLLYGLFFNNNPKKKLEEVNRTIENVKKELKSV